MADLQIIGLTKHYGTTVAVDDVNLHVADREFMTLLGPSGSGKTTVLRTVAGYVEPKAGQVVVGGRQIQREPPERRDIGMVFQSYALFPHMTVFKNVAFGLERRRVPVKERASRVAEILELVHLTGLEGRYPRQLSGGQQQRVALARALVVRPTLLLLDEPLSNLDAKLRGDVRLEIRRLQRELGITTLLVTHDQEEALTVSDRVALMRDGRLQQVASPADLYQRPANRFVADFVGKMNFIEAVREETLGDGRVRYRLPDQTRVIGPAGSERAVLAVRPEALRFGTAPDRAAANVVEGILEYRVFLGELTEVSIRTTGGLRLIVRGAELDSADDQAGTTIRVWWPVEKTAILPAE